jgi:hypothetical protein
MKKILLAISALSAALFSTAANADISVSGSMNAVYVDAEGNADAHIGGAISFSMSTTTDGGVTISAGGSLSNDNDATGNNTAATGLTSLTFGFANGSITVANDVAVPSGTGLVGELVAHADSNQVTHTNDVAINVDDGSGISGTTTLGDMSITGTHFYDGTAGTKGHTDQVSDGTITGSGISITMPLGDMSLTASSSETDENGVNYQSTGAALTMTLGDGSFGIGFESTSNDTTGVATEGEAYSATYSTTVGSAALAIGYSGFDAGSAGNTSQKTDITLSQSIGGGASVFAEMSSLTGAGAAAPGNTTSETVVAVGTSVSF